MKCSIKGYKKSKFVQYTLPIIINGDDTYEAQHFNRRR